MVSMLLSEEKHSVRASNTVYVLVIAFLGAKADWQTASWIREHKNSSCMTRKWQPFWKHNGIHHSYRCGLSLVCHPCYSNITNAQCILSTQSDDWITLISDPPWNCTTNFLFFVILANHLQIWPSEDNHVQLIIMIKGIFKVTLETGAWKHSQFKSKLVEPFLSGRAGFCPLLSNKK